MKNMFTRCRDLHSAQERLMALKKALCQKYKSRNTFEKWQDNSATTSIGCEFDLTHI